MLPIPVALKVFFINFVFYFFLVGLFVFSELLIFLASTPVTKANDYANADTDTDDIADNSSGSVPVPIA